MWEDLCHVRIRPAGRTLVVEALRTATLRVDADAILAKLTRNAQDTKLRLIGMSSRVERPKMCHVTRRAMIMGPTYVATGSAGATMANAQRIWFKGFD